MAPKKGYTPWNKNKGGGWINPKGYHCIKVEGREKKVHRLIMEKVLGRPLLPTEDIHHKDGNKLNNEPENLELLSHSDHSLKTNNRPYKRGYKLNLTNEERQRRSNHLKAVKAAIKKATL
jgi:hypothetical protein